MLIIEEDVLGYSVLELCKGGKGVSGQSFTLP